MKNILAIFRKYNYYGSVNNSLDFLLNLDDKKFKITIIFLKRKADHKSSRYINLLCKKKINFFFLDEIPFLSYNFIQKLPNFIREYFIKKKWSKFFKKEYFFDYYYLNDHLTDFQYVINKIEIKKTIFHIHYSKNLFNFNKEIINIYKQAKLNLVNNETLKEDLIKLGIDENKICELKIAIDHSRWSFDKDMAQKFRITHNIKKNKLILAGSGSISSRKGTDLFYEIFELLKKNNLHNDLEFFWLGDLSNAKIDKSQNEIQNKTTYSSFSISLKEKMINDNIKIIEASQNPFYFFNMLDILLIPSRKEVGPLTMLESMSLEKVVISYHGCGMASQALNGQSGILLEKNNPSLYFNEIKKFLKNKNKYDEIKKNAKKKVIEEFSIINQVKKVEKLL